MKTANEVPESSAQVTPPKATSRTPARTDRRARGRPPSKVQSLWPPDREQNEHARLQFVMPNCTTRGACRRADEQSPGHRTARSYPIRGQRGGGPIQRKLPHPSQRGRQRMFVAVYASAESPTAPPTRRVTPMRRKRCRWRAILGERPGPPQESSSRGPAAQRDVERIKANVADTAAVEPNGCHGISRS